MIEWLLDRFATAHEQLAFVHEGRKVSYGEVLTKISAFRLQLIQNGIRPSENVVILGDYSPEIFCLMLALALNANMITPLTRDSVIEQATALKVSGCDWFAEFDRTGLAVNFTRRSIRSDSALLNDFKTTGMPGLILFSSGSTGKPKGILHDFCRVAEKFRKQRQPMIAIPFLMIDHFGGINTILAITANLGTVITVAERSVDRICQTIADYKVELLPATPSFLTLLMASKIYLQYDLGSLKRITYGTEVMPQSTLNRMAAAFPGITLQQTYGLSEIGTLHSQSRDNGSLWVRIGGEGFYTKIIDNILWIKSDYAMIGYLNAPAAFDSEGWFNTQDHVEVDGQYFRILGSGLVN